MATTSFVDETDKENGFDGKEIVIGAHLASPAECTCSVESHEADTTSECSLL